MYKQLGDKPADVVNVTNLKGFFDAMQTLVQQEKLLAYHDRSDGGLIATLAEMAFAGHCGVSVDISALGDNDLAVLFNEELGAVIQVRENDLNAVRDVLAQHGLLALTKELGSVSANDEFEIKRGNKVLLSEKRSELRGIWAELTHQMQRLRDNPACADQEFAAKKEPNAEPMADRPRAQAIPINAIFIIDLLFLYFFILSCFLKGS